VPLLDEYDLAHHPEFGHFLASTFDLATDPLGAPGLLCVDDRYGEPTFVGQSGRRSRPGGEEREIGALVPGLEPLDEPAADGDFRVILRGLVDGVGGGWSADAGTRPGGSTAFRPPTADPPRGDVMDITGRKVLITGAGSGIGREPAGRFGAAGSAPALAGRRVDALEETAARVRDRGGIAHVVAADLADRSVVAGTVERAADALGGPACAAGAQPHRCRRRRPRPAATAGRATRRRVDPPQHLMGDRYAAVGSS
jgi:short subunit dehydrogenase